MKLKSIFIGMMSCLILSFITTDVFAIAAWARKYKFDCTVCHWNVYKLNKTGQDFLRMGHMMAKETAKDSSLSDYLSVTGKIRYNTYKKDTFEEHAFSVYTGGALDKGFSYFSEMYLHENSGQVNQAAASTDFNDYARTKLAEAFLQYTYGDESVYTTARFGQVLSQLLYIHGTGGRLGKDRSLALTSKVATNQYTPFTRQFGLEVSQYYKGLNGSFGIVNGMGTGASFNMVDSDSHKDFYASLDYEFTKEGSMVGAFGYSGIATLSTVKDHFYKVGPMFNYLAKSFTVSGLALWGWNDQANSNDKIPSVGAYLEGGYKAYGDMLTPYVRYDYFDSRTATQGKTHGPVAGVVWSPFSYGRFVGEYTRLNNPGGAATIDKFSLEAQFMF